MSAGIVFHLLAALAYAVLAVSLWRPLAGRSEEFAAGHVRRVCLAGAIVLHGIGLKTSILLPHSLHLGWALALSAAVWLGMLVFWVQSLLMRIDGLLLILLPACAVVTATAALFPGGHHVAHAASDWLRIHLLIAFTAYGLITVAALQAMLMTALDRHLHRPVEPAGTGSMLARALESMPPLLVQEVLLFRLIGTGFIVLTLTVITGAMVSLAFTNQLVPMDHKTVFTLLSWFIFGGLLVGRYTRGWRGRIALRWTLVGFAFLLLAYTGSRFVLDVILQRG